MVIINGRHQQVIQTINNAEILALQSGAHASSSINDSDDHHYLY